MNSVYGWIASAITLIYKLPQIYKIIVTKQSSDISIISYIVQSIGYVFYILHGVTNNDNPIILMGSGALFQSIILMILYYIYKNNKENCNVEQQD